MNLNNSRSAAIFLAAVIIILTAMYTYGAVNNKTKPYDEESQNYTGIIRFHVIANSDSAEDQELKLKVRDGVLAEVNNAIAIETMSRYKEGESTAKMAANEVREFIMDEITGIEERAAQIIRDEGYDYEAQADFGICWIPAKSYGNVSFPSGNYEALNITIGEGNGENWWCVLFPPLCVIDPAGSSLENIEMDGFGTTGGAITLKFKTKEIIDEFL